MADVEAELRQLTGRVGGQTVRPDSRSSSRASVRSDEIDESVSSLRGGRPGSKNVDTDSLRTTSSLAASSITTGGPKPQLSANGAMSLNTGPKGVRADARAFDASLASQAHARQQQRVFAQAAAEKLMPTTFAQDRDEEDARQRWQEKRMKELSKNYPTALSSRYVPGRLTRVDATGYLEAIDGLSEVVVLVWAFENTGDAEVDEKEAEEVEEAIERVARRYPGQRFIALDAHEAEIDAAATPAILHYADGDLRTTLMRLPDEIPSSERISANTIQQVLYDRGVLADRHKLD
ncbi:hypothetical protein PYCC9005_001191 [Savitreella phatthalungensis]